MWTRPSIPSPSRTKAPNGTSFVTDPATDVDEGAEVHDRGNDAPAPLALLQGLEELLAALALGFLEEGAAREDDVVPVPVQLDDLRLELLPHVRMEVADPAQLDQRGGEETAEPDVEDQTTFHYFDDRTRDGSAAAHDLLDALPGPLVLGSLLRQDEAALLVLLLEDERLDVVADLHHFGRVDVLPDREFLRRDDAFGLVSDVEEHLVAVHLHDGALHEVAVLEVLERFLDGLDELFGRQVVFDHFGFGAAVDPRSRSSSAPGIPHSAGRPIEQRGLRSGGMCTPRRAGQSSVARSEASMDRVDSPEMSSKSGRCLI